MPDFRYQAWSADQRLTTGVVSAENVAQALAQLEAQGLAVQSIGYLTADHSVPFSSSEPSARRERGGNQGPPAGALERAALDAHMSRVIERGREIVPALRAYADELDTFHRRQQLLTVVQVLDRGHAAEATAALQRLPSYWIPLLSAATSSRDPGRVLREFLKESQRAEELRREWWLALAYPIIVVALAIGVFIPLAVFIIPVFRQMFAEFGLKLPGLTQYVLSLSSWIASGRVLFDLALLGVAVLVLYGVSRLAPTVLVEWCGDRYGSLLSRSTAVARFAQFMADLLEAELDLPTSLRVAGFATSSPRIRRAAWRLATDLAADQPLVLHRYRPYLTATVMHLLHADLPVPVRVRMLSEVGKCHAERARSFFSWTRGMIEPLAIAAVGFVVGATVIALFLPLVSLVQGLS